MSAPSRNRLTVPKRDCRVRIDLATHDAGGITALDVKLAHSMEELAGRQPVK